MVVFSMQRDEHRSPGRRRAVPAGLVEGLIGLAAIASGLWLGRCLRLGRSEAELAVVLGVVALAIGATRSLVARGRSLRVVGVICAVLAAGASAAFLGWPYLTQEWADARPSLDQALLARDAAAVEAALSAGADPNVSQSQMTTPLIEAAGRGEAEIVRLLLKAGAEANRAAPAGLTPLIAAVSTRRLAVIPLLIEAGADPRRQTKHGSALDLAADDPEVSKLLGARSP